MDRSIYSATYEKLREWLIERRIHSAGLSLRDIAGKLDIHHSILGKMETGERSIDVVEYVQLCQAVGADPHEGIDIIIKSIKKSKL